MGGSIEFNEYSYSCPQAYKIPDKSQLITTAVCGFSCLPGLTVCSVYVKPIALSRKCLTQLVFQSFHEGII